jgi:hypothetical protein
MSTYARVLPLLLGFVLGAAVWLSSPALIGYAEPWDAPSIYYPSALLLTGIIAGGATPSKWWIGALGIFAGQAMVFVGRAVLYRPADGFWALKLWPMAIFSLVALIGAGGAALAARRLSSGRPDEA